MQRKIKKYVTKPIASTFKRFIQRKSNYAFIDAQNLHKAIKQMGWTLDYQKFRVHLTEKYNVSKAYMFMGFKPDEQEMYDFLKEAGFSLVFKPLVELKNGTIKGNCDAELVLQAMDDYPKYKQAVIVSGDGDFYCLIKHLQKKKKLRTVLIPSERNYSSLIEDLEIEDIALVSDLRLKLQYRKKRRNFNHSLKKKD